MFTRKHYKAIAEIVKDVERLDFCGGYKGIFCRNRIAKRLASYFEQDNPRFDRQKFLAACGTK